MTSSSKAELKVTYKHDPRIMGIVSVEAKLLCEREDQAAVVYTWFEDNGVLSRPQFVETIFRLVREHCPARVAFCALANDDQDAIINYWSPETIREVINGTRTASDLLIV